MIKQTVSDPLTPEQHKRLVTKKVDAQIKKLLDFKRFNVERKEQLSELMQRKSALSWKPEKKALMVRRYMTADSSIIEATNTIEYLEAELSKFQSNHGS